MAQPNTVPPSIVSCVPKRPPELMVHKGYIQSIAFTPQEGIMFKIKEQHGHREELFETKLSDLKGRDMRHIEMLLYLADGFHHVLIERTTDWGAYNLKDVRGLGAGWERSVLKCQAGIDAVRQMAVTAGYEPGPYDDQP